MNNATKRYITLLCLVVILYAVSDSFDDFLATLAAILVERVFNEIFHQREKQQEKADTAREVIDNLKSINNTATIGNNSKSYKDTDEWLLNRGIINQSQYNYLRRTSGKD